MITLFFPKNMYTYNIKFFNMVKKTDTKVFKMYNIQVH